MAGRKRLIPTPAKFQSLVDRYEAQCIADEKPITFSGLVRALGLGSKQALAKYEGYEGYGEAVAKAKLMVAEAYEQRLHGPNATGAIFALKNMGWSDKQEHEHSGEQKLTITWADEDQDSV